MENSWYRKTVESGRGSIFNEISKEMMIFSNEINSRKDNFNKGVVEEVFFCEDSEGNDWKLKMMGKAGRNGRWYGVAKDSCGWWDRVERNLVVKTSTGYDGSLTMDLIDGLGTYKEFVEEMKIKLEPDDYVDGLVEENVEDLKEKINEKEFGFDEIKEAMKDDINEDLIGIILRNKDSGEKVVDELRKTGNAELRDVSNEERLIYNTRIEESRVVGVEFYKEDEEIDARVFEQNR